MLVVDGMYDMFLESAARTERCAVEQKKEPA
jgi:hypothetical protein